MFFHALRIYKNVINEKHNKLVQLRHEDRVHEVHEVCRRICQPKRHNKILIDTVSCREGRPGYIFSTNLDLVVAEAAINFLRTLALLLVDQIGCQCVGMGTCS
jgi:hypothetical protein